MLVADQSPTGPDITGIEGDRIERRGVDRPETGVRLVRVVPVPLLVVTFATVEVLVVPPQREFVETLDRGTKPGGIDPACARRARRGSMPSS